ncbi:porphobilinogen synthase [Erythrobacteraceae bacterium CFH 75059]|uniref:porphobilinogen synthase n=1 Tax=Qipengyuania thermophila TaxID=2509361 RepID=UPI001020C34F|nr:porphobilinogen synthase [Qipengyuania thermophila]TCD06976.1 porphobilinogen synthase [Erythrobacteraceae bacterium CFH 75059]
MSILPRYPALRLRRTRAHGWSRALFREHRLSPADLVWPLFIGSGDADEEPVATLPGVSRWSVPQIAARAREAVSLGIPCIALFPNTPHDRRTARGEEALNPDNLICQAIRAVRDACGDAIGIMTDVALDPYTSHGQDGVLDSRGRIANDATVEILAQQALVQARAGADIIAPSDMMDGRVGAIRRALEEEGCHDVQILSYAAKFASAFYGPFRDAVGSGGLLKGDKKTYQMDPANGDEALREIALDIAEGADAVMVKPGLAYLDIIWRAREAFGVPVFAYQVSGEYALTTIGAAAGVGDRDALMMEKLLAFKRAGATGIVTYFARDAARLLSD